MLTFVIGFTGLPDYLPYFWFAFDSGVPELLTPFLELIRSELNVESWGLAAALAHE